VAKALRANAREVARAKRMMVEERLLRDRIVKN
jgi:hypothetical protein